jgi:hypothetical protein
MKNGGLEAKSPGGAAMPSGDHGHQFFVGLLKKALPFFSIGESVGSQMLARGHCRPAGAFVRKQRGEAFAGLCHHFFVGLLKKALPFLASASRSVPKCSPQKKYSVKECLQFRRPGPGLKEGHSWKAV